jgi:hypothetical protein
VAIVCCIGFGFLTAPKRALVWKWVAMLCATAPASSAPFNHGRFLEYPPSLWALALSPSVPLLFFIRTCRQHTRMPFPSSNPHILFPIICPGVPSPFVQCARSQISTKASLRRPQPTKYTLPPGNKYGHQTPSSHLDLLRRSFAASTHLCTTKLIGILPYLPLLSHLLSQKASYPRIGALPYSSFNQSSH